MILLLMAFAQEAPPPTRVTLTMKSPTLRSALEELGRQSGSPIQLHKSVDSRTLPDLSLEQVPFVKSLDVILGHARDLRVFKDPDGSLTFVANPGYSLPAVSQAGDLVRLFVTRSRPGYLGIETQLDPVFKNIHRVETEILEMTDAHGASVPFVAGETVFRSYSVDCVPSAVSKLVVRTRVSIVLERKTLELRPDGTAVSAPDGFLVSCTVRKQPGSAQMNFVFVQNPRFPDVTKPTRWMDGCLTRAFDSENKPIQFFPANRLLETMVASTQDVARDVHHVELDYVVRSAPFDYAFEFKDPALPNPVQEPIKIAPADPRVTVTHELRHPDVRRTLLAGEGGAFLLLEGAARNSMDVYDVRSGRRARVLSDVAEGGIACLALSDDGTHLAVGNRDSIVRVHRLSDGKTMFQAENRTTDTLFGVTEVSLSPDASLLAWRGENGVNVGDLKTGDIRFSSTDKRFEGMAISAGGALLALSRSKRIILVRLSDGTEVRELKTPNADTGYQRVRFSPDGKLLALGGWQHTWLWEVSTGTRLHTLETSSPVAFSPDGRLIASTAGIWDTVTGDRLVHLGNPLSLASSVAFLPDGLTLVSDDADLTVRLRKLDAPLRSKLDPPKDDAERARLWEKLAPEDAATAYEAMGRLVAGGDATVAFARAKLLGDGGTAAEPIRDGRVLQLLGQIHTDDAKALLRDLAALRR